MEFYVAGAGRLHCLIAAGLTTRLAASDLQGMS